MSFWLVVLLTAPVLFAQDNVPKAAGQGRQLPRLLLPDQLHFSLNDIQSPTRTLVIPDQLRFSPKDLREPERRLMAGELRFSLNETRTLPRLVIERKKRECSIPLLRVPAGPDSAGPMRIVPVEPSDRMTNRMPAPPCPER